MKLRKNDGLFFTICLVVLVMMSMLLYNDYYRIYKRNSTKQIGTITFKKKVAERKYTSQVLWGFLRNSSPVYNYDSIRTGNDSIATVYLDDNTQVELSENTLVVLSITDKITDIDFKGNSLNVVRAADTNASDSDLVISSGDTKATLKSGELIVAGDAAGALEIYVSDGSADLQVAGKHYRADTKNGFRLSSAGTVTNQELMYTTRSPQNPSSFVTTSSLHSVDFSWSSSDTQPKELTIAKDPAFKKMVLSKKDVSAEGTTISLPSGSYYWKIQSKTGQSNSAKFTLLTDHAPSLLIPAQGDQYKSASARPMIHFRWKGALYASAYQVEIFSDKTLTTKVTTLLSRSNSISTESLAPGIYYWQVKSIYARQILGDSLLSSSRSFTIIKNNNLASPIPIIEASKIQYISRSALARGKDTLNWQNVYGAASYQIEISKDKSFKTIISKTNVSHNYQVIPAHLNDGDYYWRIRAIAGDLQSNYSVQRKFIIGGLAPITLLAPLNGKKFLGSSVDLPFRWRDPNASSEFLLEVSVSKDFSKLLRSYKSTMPSLSLGEFNEGTYYWRVTCIDTDRKVIKKSEISSFSVTVYDTAPVLLLPDNRSVVDLIRADSIKFIWRAVDHATHYKVAVYRDRTTRKKALFEQVTSATSINYTHLTKFEKRGYLWEVTALQKHGARYTAISKTARGSFSITLSKRLSAPEVDLPPVIIETEGGK